ncbi:hypothetical protein [Tautonia sociabilis]|uniref:DUF2946 domain-containing protein n=1 Tax=Tautonia sociabilis TaxID=2080755 RepID=A0A432MNR7_9BACT|nr:hypothetical protein [Tautonia sociabilis]RUL89081.1 hypothetical protein TsocGM_04300 [Tautonia sociabilis]
MTDRLARQRWWLSCLYGLAVVLAQGLHSHGVPSRESGSPSAPSCSAGHDGASEEVAGLHDGGPVRSSCASDCPSCEFSLNHQGTLADPPRAQERPGFSPLPSPRPSERATVSVRPRTRAPPTILV